MICHTLALAFPVHGRASFVGAENSVTVHWLSLSLPTAPFPLPIPACHALLINSHLPMRAFAKPRAAVVPICLMFLSTASGKTSSA
jgi:hypothetical protein